MQKDRDLDRDTHTNPTANIITTPILFFHDNFSCTTSYTGIETMIASTAMFTNPFANVDLVKSIHLPWLWAWAWLGGGMSHASQAKCTGIQCRASARIQATAIALLMAIMMYVMVRKTGDWKMRRRKRHMEILVRDMTAL